MDLNEIDEIELPGTPRTSRFAYDFYDTKLGCNWVDFGRIKIQNL
jgi:hypothetical protein